MADKHNLPLLLCRPKEPCFMLKGEGDGVLFDIPTNLLTDRYKDIASDVRVRSENSEHIRVNGKIKLPNISKLLKLGREASFSLWYPEHQEYANILTEIFMKAKNVDELQSVAVYARDRVNPYLFNYCLSVALLHRRDTKGTSIPLLHETFPGKFMDSRTFIRLREETTVVPPESRMPIVIPREYTANDKEPEHALWYFREDIGINLHHHHWHLVYPGSSRIREIVDKDRRGELFYYMHQQVIARYNFERLCNNLPKVVPFSNFSEIIPEGYFSKLDSQMATRGWPSRMSGTQIRDLDRTQDRLQIPLSILNRYRTAIVSAIRQGAARDDNGNAIALTEERGIDILGNMIESSILSPSQRAYGSLHNVGHIFSSYIHDPDGRHLETFAVMGDPATAMRDPIFYRWHAFIDDLFNMHKETLTPYTAQQLTFSGIQVNSLQVQIDNGQPNRLQTFWQLSDLNLANGLDFSARGNAFVRITHLMHDPFNFVLSVNNNSGVNRIGNIRIFMAPKFDGNGQRIPFKDQRRLMVELEHFIASLAPGQNTIRRRSTMSNVTIPYERTFRTARPPPGSTDAASFDWCGCGWPYHLLIPRGTTQGFAAELFVMVSNYDEDRVDQTMGSNCADSFSYCGIQDRKYPDKKAMGYPFDRLPRSGVTTLADFLTPNMRVQDVTITLNDRRVETQVKL